MSKCPFTSPTLVSYSDFLKEWLVSAENRCGPVFRFANEDDAEWLRDAINAAIERRKGEMMATHHPQHKTEVHKRGDEYGTPQALFDELDHEFCFNLDVCASDENAKCRIYYTKEQDGLAMTWRGTCWMNPPYDGREISSWVKKAYESALDGATVVCLLPAKTDTRWWHDYCLKGEVRFLKGRIQFDGQPFKASFPSAVVIFQAIARDGGK